VLASHWFSIAKTNTEPKILKLKSLFRRLKNPILKWRQNMITVIQIHERTRIYMHNYIYICIYKCIDRYMYIKTLSKTGIVNEKEEGEEKRRMRWNNAEM
jgi:hypothetical protein